MFSDSSDRLRGFSDGCMICVPHAQTGFSFRSVEYPDSSEDTSGNVNSSGYSDVPSSYQRSFSTLNCGEDLCLGTLMSFLLELSSSFLLEG